MQDGINGPGLWWLRKTHEDDMSLRDVFVAAIAAGDWASQSEEFGVWNLSVEDTYLNQRAELYGRMADVMMKERERAV